MNTFSSLHNGVSSTFTRTREQYPHVETRTCYTPRVLMFSPARMNIRIFEPKLAPAGYLSVYEAVEAEACLLNTSFSTGFMDGHVPSGFVGPWPFDITDILIEEWDEGNDDHPFSVDGLHPTYDDLMIDDDDCPF